MKEAGIVVIVNSGLLEVAVRKLIKTNCQGAVTNFRAELKTCESGTICPHYMIFESAVIPKPKDLTLAHIKSKNPDGRMLIIETETCEIDLSPYIFDIIKLEDSWEEVNEKTKAFFEIPDNKQASTNEIISEREKEIVKLVALGKTNKEISDELFISTHTVITHRKNITAKLGIKTIAGLTVYAILNELINPDN